MYLGRTALQRHITYFREPKEQVLLPWSADRLEADRQARRIIPRGKGYRWVTSQIRWESEAHNCTRHVEIALAVAQRVGTNSRCDDRGAGGNQRVTMRKRVLEVSETLCSHLLGTNVVSAGERASEAKPKAHAGAEVATMAGIVRIHRRRHLAKDGHGVRELRKSEVWNRDFHDISSMSPQTFEHAATYADNVRMRVFKPWREHPETNAREVSPAQPVEADGRLLRRVWLVCAEAGHHGITDSDVACRHPNRTGVCDAPA